MINFDRVHVRLGLAGLALVGALLACTLRWGGEEDGNQAATPDSGSANTTPAVWIVSPADQQQVPRSQPVEITVGTDSKVTSFLLRVNGFTASTKPMPPDQSGPTTAILTWQPDEDGPYTFEVLAYNGANVSDPASITLTVSGAITAPGTTGPSVGGEGGCAGRVLISNLNYRKGPGTNTQRLGQFKLNQEVTAIGRNADTSWYKVQLKDGSQVWASNNTNWLQVDPTCGRTLPEM